MTASTVAQYLAALPADRRAAFSAVRKTINENLPDGYEEGMQFGMIGWRVRFLTRRSPVKCQRYATPFPFPLARFNDATRHVTSRASATA